MLIEQLYLRSGIYLSEACPHDLLCLVTTEALRAIRGLHLCYSFMIGYVQLQGGCKCSKHPASVSSAQRGNSSASQQ